LSPDFWIKIIVYATLALGTSILIKGIGRARRDLEPSEVAEVEEAMRDRLPLDRAVLGAVTAVAGLFAYFFLIDWIGMIAASNLAIIGFVLLCGERRLKIMLPLAALLPVGLYYFFLKVASIPMPLGIFG